MRRFMLIFLMIFLPLQWSSAAVAGCCARASTSAPPAAEAHHMMSDMGSADMHAMHQQHQAKATDTAVDKTFQHDCDAGCQNCPDCHAHAAFVLPQRANFAPVLPQEQLTSLYLSFMSDVLPDNLYRPPLKRHA